jgi:hypothetical protein
MNWLKGHWKAVSVVVVLGSAISYVAYRVIRARRESTDKQQLRKAA